MPGMSGLELQEELNSRGAMLPIIFITGHGDVPMAVEAMQRGAMDFLQKPFRDQDLLDRINGALERDRVGRELLGNRERIQARIAELTPREREVLTLVTRGQGEQGHRRRSAVEPADGGDSSRACHGEDGRELAGAPGTHGGRRRQYRNGPEGPTLIVAGTPMTTISRILVAIRDTDSRQQALTRQCQRVRIVSPLMIRAASPPSVFC